MEKYNDRALCSGFGSQSGQVLQDTWPSSLEGKRRKFWRRRLQTTPHIGTIDSPFWGGYHNRRRRSILVFAHTPGDSTVYHGDIVRGIPNIHGADHGRIQHTGSGGQLKAYQDGQQANHQPHDYAHGHQVHFIREMPQNANTTWDTS